MINGDPLIEFIGEIGDHQKSAFLGGRKPCCSRSTGRNPLAW
jgi:hypothetical protein